MEGRRLLHILWELFDRHALWTRRDQAPPLLAAMAAEVLRQGQPQALLMTASLASRAGGAGTCQGGRDLALEALGTLVEGLDEGFLNPAAVVVMRCVVLLKCTCWSTV